MKNSTIRYVFILFAFISLYLTSCHKDDEIKLDFDLTAPASWQTYIYGNLGIIYASTRKPETATDTILESLIIIKSGLSGYDLNSYYNWLKPQIEASESYDSLLYESDTLINGTSFKKMLSLETWLYLNTNGHDTSLLNALTTRYFFYEKNYGYNMVFISMDTAFYRNQPVFNNIMSTFRYHN